MGYRLNEGVSFEKLDDGTSFLVNIETGKIFMLNSMGYEIIERVSRGLSVEEIINDVFSDYRVEDTKATEDITHFLEALEREGHIVK